MNKRHQCLSLAAFGFEELQSSGEDCDVMAARAIRAARHERELLVAQCFDRIESRCFSRGIISKNDSHSYSDSD